MLPRETVLGGRVKLAAEEVSDTRLHFEQLPDRHLGRSFAVGVIGQVLPDRVVERELSFLGKLSDGNAREDLVYGA